MTGNIASRISAILNDNPEKVILRFLDKRGSCIQSLTANQLHKMACNLASALNKRGIYKHPLIIAMDTSPDFIISLLACFYAGIIIVPVPIPRPGAHINRLEGIIDDCRPGAILCSKESAPYLQNYLDSLEQRSNCLLIKVETFSSHEQGG